jgi:hypothetical protein
MSQKKYKATLTQEEEDILHDIMNRGKHGVDFAPFGRHH